ncbi:MAG: hypothetical protein JRE40_02380 [Deltaproteobacteria bacterium]|nr:hypothetical protein [Deltaproteobacteria bacterium]
MGTTPTKTKRETKYEVLIDATVERETEKAVLLDVTYDSHCGLSGWKVWFPKSTIHITNGRIEAAQWIIWKKVDEIDEKSHTGCFRILTEQIEV